MRPAIERPRKTLVMLARRAGGLLLGLLPLFGAAPVHAGATDFYTVPPCRLVDTVNVAGPLGGPDIPANGTRSFAAGGRCGISTAAEAVAVNVTVVPASYGNLSFAPAGSPKPPTSTINFRPGVTRANNAILPLGQAAGLTVFSSSPGSTRLVIDVTGYFADSTLEATRTAPPAFNPPPGSYLGEQLVDIVTSTAGATIRYTTDGSTPTSTSGTVYTGPVTLTGTTTLKAIAYKSGLADSPVSQGTYNITRQATLFLATLTPQGSSVSLATGRASLLLAADEQTAVLRRTWSNLTTTLTSSHIHAPDGQILFDLDNAVPAQDGSLTWTIGPAGTWTRAQILDALRAGQCYLNLHTVSYPSGEIKGFFRRSDGSIVFTPPPAPPPAPTGPPNAADAARFLVQATYGPTTTAIASLQTQTYSDWVEQQLAQPVVSHMAYVDALPHVPGEDLYQWEGRESIWKQAIQGQDQLRQRVALALSEILVASSEDSDLYQAEPVAAYMDVLNRDAFGNFRQLLEDVALSPSMGVYLDMLGNDKEDPETGQNPEQELRPRGPRSSSPSASTSSTPTAPSQLDTLGLPIATYDQDVIKGFAKVFTGWTFANQDHSVDWRFYWPEPDWRHPMEVWNEHHSTGSKLLLNGVVLPPDQSPQADLAAALDNIFAAPNVGPFLCKRSHPAAGDQQSQPGLRLPLRPGLRQQRPGRPRRHEGRRARDLPRLGGPRPDLVDAQGYGKVSEPMVRFVDAPARLRRPAAGRRALPYLDLEQRRIRARPVPLARPRCSISSSRTTSCPARWPQAGLVAPEFKITTETTAIGNANFFRDTVYRGVSYGLDRVTPDYS